MSDMPIEGTTLNPTQLIILCELYMWGVLNPYLHKSIYATEVHHLVNLDLISVNADDVWALTKAGGKYMNWVMEVSNANLPT